ncbi:class I SAM-dependent methyltransferase [Dietzia sp. ANT_WB102]|uniref:class I SAM-dependent methyltransferase n=1 Tax=Dietzia sp. ANT_WB102 TaxID=2597345 RepID=UPI0011EFD917|nr:class I SAM-dependent methyltransferase [Dietzia sp. ANT_WB102]KAA0919270.1 class I SAM-dependent methyltransferase [Dietzia sp. ANT_WB102]
MSASQAGIWSGPVGDSWVRNAAAYDRALEPLGRAALDLLELGPHQRVLDVGCGTGTTTLEIARRVHPGGSVVGVDVSRPMIEYARARISGETEGENVEFAVLDVEKDDLPGPFDAAFSRLGVMFFDHPTVAFANIASSLKARSRFAFVCFKTPSENPFISIPVEAALAELNGPGMPPRGAAGPFSLADPDMVRGLLESAGFESVVISSGPDEVTLGPASELDDLARQAVEQNPVVMPLLISNAHAREAAVEAAATALRDHVHTGDVRLGAGTWLVEARVADR